MADPVHSAQVGHISGQEKELKGGSGPWIMRTYHKGNTELEMGTVAAISDADDLVYAYDSTDNDLNAIKGVVLETAAADAVVVTLVVFGTVNRAELNMGGSAPDLAQLRALEDAHIYAVG